MVRRLIELPVDFPESPLVKLIAQQAGEVLVGKDQAPTPVEFLLHALGSCLMAGIANIAAARRVNLTSVEATIEGDVNLQGLLGISNEVRNGYRQIRVSFKIAGDASP